MQNRFTRAWSGVTCLLALALVVSCSGGGTVDPTPSGSVQFSMPLQPARELGFDIGRVHADLTRLAPGGGHAGGDLAISPDSSEASGTIDELIPGTWRVNIAVYDPQDSVFAAGETTCVVVEGDTTDVHVMIRFETGAAHIVVTWVIPTMTGWGDFDQGAGLDSTVMCAVAYNGHLVVGGNFRHAGGVSADRIALWNGSSWVPLGSGLDAPCWSLAVYDGQLIAGGHFGTAGGVAASRVAAWNGSAWHALGSGLSGGPQPEASGANALCVYEGNLIAGGDFANAGGVAANHIASWNGSSWAALGTGADNYVEALVVAGGDLVAGGWFSSIGGVSASKVARWNGSSWTAMGSGMSGGSGVVIALASDGTSVYAVGDFSNPGPHAAQWNGASWSAMGTGFSSNAWAAAVYLGSLYAGGSFTTADGNTVNHVAKWDGSGWVDVDGGVTGSNVSGLCVSGDALYVGGTFTSAGGVPVHNIARWRD